MLVMCGLPDGNDYEECCILRYDAM